MVPVRYTCVVQDLVQDMEQERSEYSRQLEALRVELLTKEQALEKLQAQLSIISTLNEAAILGDEKEKEKTPPPPLEPPLAASAPSGALNALIAPAAANGPQEGAASAPAPPPSLLEALTLQRQKKQLELKYAAALRQIYGTTLELKRYVYVFVSRRRTCAPRRECAIQIAPRIGK